VAEARREEWLRRFREGKRVRIYRGYLTRRSAAIALAVSFAFVVAEVIMVTREADLVELLLLPLVPAISIFGAIYEWGRVAHSAVQLADEQLLLWDWRNKERRFAYRGLEAVACIKRFPRHRTVRVCGRAEDRTASLEWTALLTWPGSTPTACEVAEELARRAGLTLRSEGLWARPYVQEVPPVLFWE